VYGLTVSPRGPEFPLFPSPPGCPCIYIFNDKEFLLSIVLQIVRQALAIQWVQVGLLIPEIKYNTCSNTFYSPIGQTHWSALVSSRSWCPRVSL